MHGLATLLLAGNVPADAGRDPEAQARSVAGQLPVPAGTIQRFVAECGDLRQYLQVQLAELLGVADQVDADDLAVGDTELERG